MKPTGCARREPTASLHLFDLPGQARSTRVDWHHSSAVSPLFLSERNRHPQSLVRSSSSICCFVFVHAPSVLARPTRLDSKTKIFFYDELHFRRPSLLSAAVFFSRFARRLFFFSPCFSSNEPRSCSGVCRRAKPFSHEEHSAFLDAMERYGQESTGNEWEKIAQVRISRQLDF